MDNLTLEKIPATGVFQSFNGTIYLGGHEMLRISNAIVRATTNPGKYPEVGTRFSTPYRRETRVSFSYTRAMINLYETLLSLGFPVSKDFTPGELYSENAPNGHKITELLNTLAQSANYGTTTGAGLINQDGRPVNHYAVKTDAQFIVNKDGVISGDMPVIDDLSKNLDGAKAYQQSLLVEGAIIDVGQISVGAAGDLIMAGPYDVLAEAAYWTLVDITPT
jgi:hypothetical protein